MSNLTDLIKDGKGTDFQQWALRCARSMGQLASQIAGLEKLSADEALKQAQEENSMAVASLRTQLAHREEYKNRLATMMCKVLHMGAPSVQHEALKAFMKQQIEIELQALNDNGFLEERLYLFEQKQIRGAAAGEEWRAAKLATLKAEVGDWFKQIEGGVEPALWTKDWLNMLLNSLSQDVPGGETDATPEKPQLISGRSD